MWPQPSIADRDDFQTFNERGAPVERGKKQAKTSALICKIATQDHRRRTCANRACALVTPWGEQTAGQGRMTNIHFNNAILLAARIMLALMFVNGGFGKLMNSAGAIGYMDKVGISPSLLPLVILTELGVGLLILIGFQTRVSALVLAGFTLLAGLLVHLKAGDFNNMIHFWKNLSIAGGFVALVAAGAGDWSVDGLLNRRRGAALRTA
jgi:putative oxidoreductase